MTQANKNNSHECGAILWCAYGHMAGAYCTTANPFNTWAVDQSVQRSFASQRNPRVMEWPGRSQQLSWESDEVWASNSHRNGSLREHKQSGALWWRHANRTKRLLQLTHQFTWKGMWEGPCTLVIGPAKLQ